MDIIKILAQIKISIDFKIDIKKGLFELSIMINK